MTECEDTDDDVAPRRDLTMVVEFDGTNYPLVFEHSLVVIVVSYRLA